MFSVLKGPTAWERRRRASRMEPLDERASGQPRFLAQAFAWVEYRRITLELFRRELAACTAEEAAATGPGREG